jgi:hypothetical protein
MLAIDNIFCDNEGSQRIAKIFGTSRTPRLAFCLETSIASVLQISSPVSNSTHDTSRTAMVRIKRIRHKYSSPCQYYSIHSICPLELWSNASCARDSITTKTILAKVELPNMPNRLNTPGSPSDTQTEAHTGNTLSSSDSKPLRLPIADDTYPLNLGRKLNLKLDHDKFQFPDVPTFITYNIKRRYELKWKMGLELGGKSLTVKGRHLVLIMGRSDQHQEG